MKIAAVVFDMDGLMLDTEPLSRLCWTRAASELGHELDDPFYMTFIGRTTLDCESRVIQRFGTDFPMEAFRTRRRRLWHEYVDVSGIPIKPGLMDVLALLEACQVPFGVATSNHARGTAASLRAAGLHDRFDVIVTADEVARGKPAPDLYLEAARRLGVTAAECLALEDSNNGVTAASAAGMTTLMIPDIESPSPDAAERAFRVFASLDEARPLISTLLATGPG